MTFANLVSQTKQQTSNSIYIANNKVVCSLEQIVIIIIIMQIYHALINALSAHMIHINLNTILNLQVEHSPTKTIYRIIGKRTHMHTHTHTHINCNEFKHI